MSEDSVNQPSSPRLDHIEGQVNRLVEQMGRLAAMQKVSYKSFTEVTTIENRRYALELAARFLTASGSTPKYLNSAAVIGVADMWTKWLEDGTQPDMEVAAAGTAAFAWGIANGLFPDSVIEAAKAAASHRDGGVA